MKFEMKLLNFKNKTYLESQADSKSGWLKRLKI